MEGEGQNTEIGISADEVNNNTCPGAARQPASHNVSKNTVTIEELNGGHYTFTEQPKQSSYVKRPHVSVFK